MANIPESPLFDADIYQIETTDKVLGGPDGVVNLQAKQLANRTAYLKQEVEAAGGTAGAAEAKADSALAQIASAETAMGNAAASAAEANQYKQDALAAKALAEQARSNSQADAAAATSSAQYAAADRQLAQQAASGAQANATASIQAYTQVASARDVALAAKDAAVAARGEAETFAGQADADRVAAETAATAAAGSALAAAGDADNADAARVAAEAARDALLNGLAGDGGAEMVGVGGGRKQSDKNSETVSITDYPFLAIDGASDNTAAIQSAIDYASANGYTLTSPPGVWKHTGLRITKPLKWVGQSVRGPVYGLQTSYKGAVFQFTALSGDALSIDASLLLSNQGLCVELSSMVFDGNKNVVGATSGGGINLIGDKAGEAFYVTGSIFTNIQVRNSKGAAWTITGTCFLNDWYNCAAVYSGSHGVTYDRGSGNPGNNNWHNCMLNDNAGFGLNCLGGKMTMNTCNISQNAGGGVNQSSGYLILDTCDFEANAGTVIQVSDSSNATHIIGGMIHKTPGGAANTGIYFGAGCAGNSIDGTLFANFDNAADRIVDFGGGASLEKFDYRTQNCLSSAFPASSWVNINQIPPKEKTRRGSVTFTGSGVGQRTASIAFSSAFEADYTIVLILNGAFIDPSKVSLSVDYTTQSLASISAKAYVSDAGYGDVSAMYIAIGR